MTLLVLLPAPAVTRIVAAQLRFRTAERLRRGVIVLAVRAMDVRILFERL
jgi:hypothetical protein